MALTKVRGAGVDFDGQDVILDADGDTKIAAGTDDIITVSTAGTERVRVLAGGGLDLSAGNLVLDNGYGIEFTATANSSGTVTHEILDDYEIGTFTPAYTEGLTSVSYQFRGGKYTKVGRLVYFQISIRASAATTNGNQVRISGLPFNSDTSASAYGGAFITYNNNFYVQLGGPTLFIQENDTELLFYKKSDGGTLKGNDSDLQELNDIHINGFYMT